MKKTSTYTFSDLDTEAICKKNYPDLVTIKEKMNWEPIAQIIDNAYTVGKQNNGRAAYPGLLLFRIQILAFLFKHTDRVIVQQCNVNVCYRYFLGLGLTDRIPSYSRLSSFRYYISKSGAYEDILDEVVRQFIELGLIDLSKLIVDSSIVTSAANPDSNKREKIDPDAAATKKNKGVLIYR